MDILEEHGIKIPNSVLVKYTIDQETDDEVVDFLSQYGKQSKAVPISESGSVFDKMFVVEWNALVELGGILPYTHVCQSEKCTYDICELATACSDLGSKLKTQTYLSDLKNLAKQTGQDYADVLRGVMSLLGQSIHELSNPTETRPFPDASGGVMDCKVLQLQPRL